MNVSYIRNRLLLLTLSLYLLFNYGFMQLRLPPGSSSGVPVGEIMLLLSLFTMRADKVLYRLSKTVVIFPFLLWWLLGLGRALVDTAQYGFWALRDASQVIESSFLIVGFSFAEHLLEQERLFRWLRWLLLAAVLYTLSYPFADFLIVFSPKVVAGAGHDVSVLFNYANAGNILLTAAAYLLLFQTSHKGLKDVKVVLPVTFLLCFAVFLLQARTIYLQVIALTGLFFWYRRDLLVKNMLGVGLVILLLFFIPLVGLDIKGRLGQSVSLEFLINHFLAIGGVTSPGVEGSAAGVSLRIGWWLTLYDRWTTNVSSFLFGLGYGQPLIDFRGHFNVIVREPHNSYISVLARLGLTGAIVWTWMHILLINAWRRCYQICHRLHWKEGENRLLLLMVFFILIWVLCIGEDGLEKPYNTIPYYFLWGIVLRFSYHLKTGLRIAKIHPRRNRHYWK